MERGIGKAPLMARAGSSSRIAHNNRSQYVPLADDTHQQSIVVDDDLSFTIVGRQETPFGMFLYYFISVITGGLFYLACRWHLQLEVGIKTIPCTLREATHIVITNQWDEISLVKIGCLPLNALFSQVFPNFFENNRVEDCLIEDLRYFEYRYFKFLMNPISGLFEANYAWCDPNWTSVGDLLNGKYALNQQQVEQRAALFGPNTIEIKGKSTLRLLFDEVLHPFFVFQIASIILWTLDNYVYYATSIFVITTVSTAITLFETKRNLKRMKDLARFSCQVRLWRNNGWYYCKSEDMVPGDIFEIESGELPTVPCDAVLLEGDCILNESMLTGESLPVSKTPITDKDLQLLDFDDEEPASSSRMALYFLFSGTKLIRVRKARRTESDSNLGLNAGFLPNNSNRGAIALVVRTGFNTSKGSLVRSMLFPRPNQFKFYQDSFRFIGVLAIISFLGFLLSLYNFIRLKVDWETILFRALDLITIAVPPALPATMAIGTSFAINRLRKSDIFCTSPPRVNICGKLNMMCFDKTGTLTEEGLDVLGIRFTLPLESKEDSPLHVEPGVPLRFSRLYKNIDSVLPKPLTIPQVSWSERGSEMTPLTPLMSGISLYLARDPKNPTTEADFPYPSIVCAMATCHSIKVVYGELIGDPLDLKMFGFTGWHLEEDGMTTVHRRPSNTHRLMAVRPPYVPDFDSVKANYTVKEEEYYTEIEVIRSFEFLSSLRRMSVICRKHHYSSSLESRYSKDWDVYVKGAPEIMRDICLKESLPADFDELLKYYTHHGYRVLGVAWKTMQVLPLHGLAKLKRNVVEKDLQFLGFIVFENKLKPGTIPVIQTLNKACIRLAMCTGDNLLTAISVSRECGLVDPVKRIYIPKFVQGQPHEEDAMIEWEDVDDTTKKLDSVTLLPLTNISSTRRNMARIDYELAITGDVFQWMLDFADDSTFERMLVKCQIYSRMSPDLKHFLVQNLQSIGYCVGFCGDGTNDCGALKSADAGLSLSEAEASVAAPFTSKQMDLDCVLKVIREGRAALVTSFCSFKYMALYSLIQFTSVSLLYTLAQNLSDMQFMMVDFAVISPVAIFMGQTGPHPQLHPKRPTASLLSKKVLSSMIGQFMIQFMFQAAAFLWIQNQPWYQPGNVDIEQEIYQSMENTTVFLISFFQYLLIAIVFTVGPPYQETIWKNVPYITIIILLAVFISMTELSPPTAIKELLKMVDIPFQGRAFLFGLSVLNFAVSWVGEKYVFPYVAQIFGQIAERLGSREPYDFDDENIPAQQRAKYLKWERAGKRFKIIRREMERRN